jgi:hypothetical protein
MVNARVRARDLVGRRITAVEFRQFPDGRGGRASKPVLTLDNGRRVFFITEETDVGEYGTRICIAPGDKGAAGK